MRKFYLMMTVLVALGFSSIANAGTKNLVKMDFESGDPASLGWFSPNLPGGMAITGDDYGNFFQFSLGGSNGRSCYNTWGSDVFTDQLVDGTYHVEFEWCYYAFATNQFGTEFAIYSGTAPGANNGTINARENCLFSITESADNHELFFVNGDVNNTFAVAEGNWYTVLMDVDTNNRTIKWQIVDQLSRQEVYAAGTRTFEEGTDMLASGLNIYDARYWSVTQLDNLKVQVILPYDIANIPTIALVGVNNTERTYSIAFQEEEELHFQGTTGGEQVVAYMDCDGVYTYSTTTSGTLVAWTVSGTATSEKVTADVDCSIINLPEAVVTITNADAGFAKDYTITVDNSDVPTKPTIFISYEYTDENGTEVLKGEDVFSGEVVHVATKGVLTVHTIAPGFGTTTISETNDKEFEVEFKIDFQHMTADLLKAKGFVDKGALDEASGGGMNTWTSGGRLYYRIETGETDDEGNPTYTNYIVYGSSESGYMPIPRYVFYQSNLTEEVAHSLFAPFYTWYYNDGVVATSCDADGNPLVDDHGYVGGSVNVQVWPGVGFVFGGVQGDEENYDPANVGYGNIRVQNATLGVDGLTDDQFIIVSKIGAYGNTAVHPVYPVGTDPEDAKADYLNNQDFDLGGAKEVYTGTQTFQLYRIDTAISRVTILSPKGGSGIENVNTGVIVSDHNAPIFNLNGVQVNPSTLKKGVYVKQGKKFVVQ